MEYSTDAAKKKKMTVTALCHPQHQEGWPTEFYCTPAEPEAPASPPQGVTLARPGSLLDMEIESIFQRETEKQADFVFTTRPWHKFKQTGMHEFHSDSHCTEEIMCSRPPTIDTELTSEHNVNVGKKGK